MAKGKKISGLPRAESIENKDLIPIARNIDGDQGKYENLAIEAGALKAIPVIEQSGTEVTIEPNVLNRWGVVESLTIDFAPSDSDKVAEYMVEFISGETAATLSLPAEVQFPLDVEIEPNTRYQLSVVDNLGLIAGVPYEEM